MSKNPWSAGNAPDPSVGLVSSRVVHDGRIVHLSVDRVRFPDGSEGELELIRHKGASAVVPLLGTLEDEDPQVVLVHQYRYAAGGFVYEVPAGIPGKGEAWDACARRELEEETGFVAETLIPLTSLFTTPGFTNEVIHLFVALGLTPGRTERDEDEFIEVVHMPFSRALEMIRDGEIRDGKSMIALLYTDRFLRRGRGEPVHASAPETS